jgi:hypothetical protein
MLYWELRAGCCENHTKDIKSICGQNAEFLNVSVLYRLGTAKLRSERKDTSSRDCLLLTEKKCSIFEGCCLLEHNALQVCLHV